MLHDRKWNAWNLVNFFYSDFQVLLDEDGNPVAQSNRNSSNQHERWVWWLLIHELFSRFLRFLANYRVAILLKPPYAFTSNVRNLRGLHMLHQQNLEILGYRVLEIPYHEWNSLLLHSLEAKCNYLSDRLFPTKNTWYRHLLKKIGIVFLRLADASVNLRTHSRVVCHSAVFHVLDLKVYCSKRDRYLKIELVFCWCVKGWLVECRWNVQ